MSFPHASMAGLEETTKQRSLDRMMGLPIKPDINILFYRPGLYHVVKNVIYLRFCTDLDEKNSYHNIVVPCALMDAIWCQEAVKLYRRWDDAEVYEDGMAAEVDEAAKQALLKNAFEQIRSPPIRRHWEQRQNRYLQMDIEPFSDDDEENYIPGTNGWRLHNYGGPIESLDENEARWHREHDAMEQLGQMDLDD